MVNGFGGTVIGLDGMAMISMVAKHWPIDRMGSIVLDKETDKCKRYSFFCDSHPKKIIFFLKNLVFLLQTHMGVAHQHYTHTW